MSDVQISPKGFTPTVLLCMFFGLLGIHRFYVGKIGTGLLQLVTFGAFGIWTLIDYIILLTGSFRDKEGFRVLMPESDNISSKDFTPTALLCMFFGWLGFHRFYVGKILTGILMLLTLGGFGIWALIDFIILVSGSFTDKQGLPIRQTAH